MILHDRCSTSYDPASLFHGRRNAVQMERKNRNTQWYEAVSSALNFPYLRGSQKSRKPRKIAKFDFSCQIRIFEEFSQNFFGLNLSTPTFAGTLAELLPFTWMDGWMGG